MAETRNIVILGAQSAGLSAAHYIARHVLPKLQQAKDFKYVLHLVDPSTHFWWHISAPRAIVSTSEIKDHEYFVPIKDGFSQYPQLKDAIVFHQASATALDTTERIVTITKESVNDGMDETSTLSYYALIIATGIRSPTPLTTLHGSHEKSQKALNEMNSQLKTAKSIVIAGGGPIGVETAGEIASAMQSRNSSGKDKATVTLIAGSKKLIPIFREKRAKKVQSRLEKLGVKIIYGARVKDTTTTTSRTADGTSKLTTTVNLDNGDSISDVDVYIPAVGVEPNTSFLPAALRKENGYVKTNPKTLRVDDAGARVYAVGDVADVNLGGMLHLFDSVPVFGANFAHDLLEDAKLKGMAPPEKSYARKDGETQLVPVGRKTGVGAFNGNSVPGFLVAMFKGKDYMKGQIPKMTTGSQWKKA